MTPERIAIVAPNFHPRTCGIGDYSMRLAQSLSGRGHPVAVFSRAPARPHPEAPEVPVVAAAGGSPWLRARGIAASIDSWGASRVIVQYIPTMFGASRFGTPAGPWLVARMKRRERAVDLIVHELALPWSRRPDLLVAASVQRVQLGLAMRPANRVFATTDDRRERLAELARSVGAHAKVDVLPVGPGALPLAAKPESGRCAIGLFSTLAYGKRFDVVLGAFRDLARRRPNARLVLIGDLGTAQQRRFRQLLGEVARHPFADRIRLTGKIPLARVAAEVAGLDLFLFPLDTGATTRSGTLPVALGAGVPVVAIRGSETDRHFRHRENVFFAEELTGPAFAEAGETVLGDEALRHRLSRGGHRLYETRLCWPVIAGIVASAEP